MEKTNFNSQEKDAMRVYAMLNGISIDSLLKNDNKHDCEKNYEVKKKPEQRIENNTEYNKRPEQLPVLKCFDKLKNRAINVVFNEHNINYKEQRWPIPRRVVRYEIDLVKSPKISRDLAILSKCTDDEVEKAYKGEIRFVKLITRESVKYEVNEIGFAKISAINENQLHTDCYINTAILRKNNVNADKVLKDFVEEMRRITK